MNKYMRLLSLAVLSVFSYLSCSTQKKIITAQETENCGVIDTLSNFYQQTKDLTWEDMPSLVPTGKDADESLFIIKELKKRLGDSNLSIGRKPQVMYSVISMQEPFDEKDVDRVSCILKEIHDEYQTKPIFLRLVGIRQVKDELMGETVNRRVPFRQYVIE